ncbi:MAG TPA: class I SAM-dependent methyltransferase, partial [Pilimelia sp.]|nr:class I SAM-dependent methyltransferase [Pilimelia sp.]
GTGAGTLALARQLPGASLVAVDRDEELLAHLRHRAAEAGVADRVRTVVADLDGVWPPGLGPADLVWASAALHHLADPAGTLARVRGLLRTGGAFMIVELDAFPRFRVDPAGAALEDRCHAELARLRHEAGLHMGLDWGAALQTAGFAVDGERRFDIALRPPLPAGAARYARESLRRARHRLADRLDAAELADLDALTATDPDPADLVVRTTRTVWVGRRR